MGALMTLLYGLGAAPASQPRNAIFGQVISMSIGIGIGSIPGLEDPSIPQSLAVALSVGAMAKLGLTHPPAGATAVLFATGFLGGSHMLAVLIGTVVAIALATLLSNWSNKRQYPSYWWGIPPNILPNAWMMKKWKNRSSSS
jgi:CBS-domain-containing membrane protein